MIGWVKSDMILISDTICKRSRTKQERSARCDKSSLVKGGGNEGGANRENENGIWSKIET